MSSIPPGFPSFKDQISLETTNGRKLVKVKVKATFLLTVSQSVSLGGESHLGHMTRYLLFFDRYGLVFVGQPL
jgi:hypothetical protein